MWFGVNATCFVSYLFYSSKQQSFLPYSETAQQSLSKHHTAPGFPFQSYSQLFLSFSFFLQQNHSTTPPKKKEKRKKKESFIYYQLLFFHSPIFSPVPCSISFVRELAQYKSRYYHDYYCRSKCSQKWNSLSLHFQKWSDLNATVRKK